MNKSEKLLLVVGVILLVVMGGLIYFSWHKASTSKTLGSGEVSGTGQFPTTSDTTTDLNTSWNQNTTTENLPDAVKQKLVQLTQEPTIGITVKTGEQKVLYFNRGTGNLFQIPFDGVGGAERLSSNTIKNIIDVGWSTQRKYAFISTLNDSTTKSWWLQIVGTTTKTGAYPNEALSFSFSPTEDKVAIITRTDLGNSLMISDPTGKKELKVVANLPLPDFQATWIEKNTLALSTRASYAAPSILETMSTSGGSPTILDSGPGLHATWNPVGSYYIQAQSNGSSPNISLSLHSRAKPNDSKNLQFSTLPEKCVFSASSTPLTVYCAIPKSMGSEPLPDGWWQGKTHFDDGLWKINLATGKTTPIIENSTFDMTDLTLSPKEDYIFFLNKKDSTLWSYKLQD